MRPKDAKLDLREVPLSDLQPAEYNPRVELQPGDPEYEKIRRSIEEFGYVDPIIANADGTIIGGHQRYNVLSSLGYETVQVVFVDLDKTREKALNLALNKITGSWDEEKVYDLLLELDLSDIDMQLTGFERNELEALTVKFAPEASDDGFDPDEALKALKETKEPLNLRGRIWQLGEHRLMCGDATSSEDMAALMDGEKANLVLTDPPYNVDYATKIRRAGDSGTTYRNKSRQSDKIINDKMSDSTFAAFLQQTFGLMSGVMRPGAAFYIFYPELKVVPFMSALEAAGLKLTETLIWEKNHFVLGLSDYHRRHEPILYGWKEGARHYFIQDRTQDTVFCGEEPDFRSMKKAELTEMAEAMWSRLQQRSSVLFEAKPPSSKLHPTMKPVPLMGRLMTNSSRQGNVVLDPFGGSGPVLIAAQQLGRRARLMELNPEYCRVIVSRWEEYTGQEAVMVNG